MKVNDFFKICDNEAERIANDIFEYVDFILHKNRKYKAMGEEYIPLRAYLKRKNIPLDAGIELGGEAHDFDAIITYKESGEERIAIIEIVQALPVGEHLVRMAVAKGKMDEKMRLEEWKQLGSFPQPIIDAINKKHEKMYADKRTLLVSVIGEHTFEDNELINGWIADVQTKTELGNFSEIYLVETARSLIFKVH